MFHIVIPLKAASGVGNERHNTRASIDVEVQIRSLKKSNACILEFQVSEEHVLKAVSMANGLVEHMTSEGHLSGDDFPIGIIGDEVSCLENAKNATTSPDGEQQDRNDPDIHASWTFVPEIKAEELTTPSLIKHAKVIINKVQKMDVPAVKSAVERAFRKIWDPCLNVWMRKQRRMQDGVFCAAES